MAPVNWEKTLVLQTSFLGDTVLTLPLIAEVRRRFPVKHFPTEPRGVFDVTGAGDTVVAVCALALACGAGFAEAAVLANIAAGFVGDEVGTVAVPIEKLKRSIEAHS